MSPITQLVGFGLRQVIGDYADGAVQIAVVIEQRFRDHSRTLPKALNQAHHRAWQSLGVALAGDGLLDRVKVFFASGDDKGVREQVQLFLDGNAVSFDGAPADFRRDCLDELQRLRKSGRLFTPEGAHAALARQAACFARHADPQGLVEEARRAVHGVADALAENYPNLARLLRTPTPAGPPLLAAAFCYFFRREVETNDELAHGLFFDGLRQLSASQAKAFGEVGKALASLGGQFDALLEQLGRIEAAVEETHAVAVETHGAVLDIQTELQRSHGEARILMEQVLLRLGQVGMARGEVRPGNSCSIRGEDERRAVKALLARYRELPAEEQRQAPALLNGLGKLQVGTGDFTEARQTFTEVVAVVGNPTDKAEASFNAYRAALEEKKWDAALSALREAGSHDPQRFAPFPLHRYEPKRILGAGGFGTAVLCLDRHFDEDVVVKTLHAADLARGVDEVFREARILRRLSHPAIIGVRDCEYADPANKGRPYLVMDHFPGGTLQEFVDKRGPLNLEQLLAVAVQVAEGTAAAHTQGVLHRDLKPANLLVRKEGNLWKVKIIDFGMALRQQTLETSRVRAGATQKSMLDWSVAGTMDYSPPEQLGKLVGVQPAPYSDAFAFARTCCYAMFKTTELRRKQWESLPGPLADLLEGCLDPDPRQRPKSFKPVLAVLGECSRVGEETRHREQEERLRREQEAELRSQMEAEEELRKLVHAALERTRGKPTPDDTVKAQDLCRRTNLLVGRANAVVQKVREGWRHERDAKERAQKRQQEERQQQKQGKPRREEEGGKMPFRFICPRCSKTINAPGFAAGRQVKCPSCTTIIIVPGGDPVMAAPAPEELLTNSIDMKLALVPAGTFLMGTPENEPGTAPEAPQHEVTISKPFYLGVCPVTQEQYERVMGANPSHFSPQGGGKEKVRKQDTRNFPVERVSWDGAVAFCRKLSELPEEKRRGRVYRLPTEAEWEYSSRGGALSSTPFYFGRSLSSSLANFNNSLGRTTAVGSYQANGFGLHDMHGNVSEWCADWYDANYYANSPNKDPQGPQCGENRLLRDGLAAIIHRAAAVNLPQSDEGRVLRGGDWSTVGDNCRSATRLSAPPDGLCLYVGFRVALTVAVRTL